MKPTPTALQAPALQTLALDTDEWRMVRDSLEETMVGYALNGNRVQKSKYEVLLNKITVGTVNFGDPA